jgi:hypothetical protein
MITGYYYDQLNNRTFYVSIADSSRTEFQENLASMYLFQLFLMFLTRLRLIVALSFISLIPIISIILYLEWSRTDTTSNINKCTELAMLLEKRVMNYNLSLDNYKHHAHALETDIDLIGDLAVWHNQLKNQQRYIKHELLNSKDCPNTQNFRYGNVSHSITIR